MTSVDNSAKLIRMEGIPQGGGREQRPIYLGHARWRMAQRGITEEQVEHVLRHYDVRRPAFRSPSSRTPTEIFIGDCAGRRLKVYVEQGSDPPRVRTAVWEGD